jgi:Zn-dependent M28 family amino/carboxypeptidase
MEIAQAFSALEKKPKRSVVFVLFGGEEMGLQGSTYFVEHVPEVFTNVDAMFNFDMVGAGDGAGCGISEKPAGLKIALEEANERVKILRRSRYLRRVGVRGSDYAAFFAAGIPCISFSSNGPHLSYHQPGDTIYRINPDIMADIARLAFLTAYAWAER